MTPNGQAVRLFVPKQAVGANLVYFDLFNPSGSGKTIIVRSVVPLVSGAVAVTGVVGVDLFLTYTTAVGTGGTAATYQGTDPTACTFTDISGGGAMTATITARLTPSGGATAGAVVSMTSVFSEETSPGTYGGNMHNFIDRYANPDPVIVPPGKGIRVVQGAVASVGNIGFDVAFDLV